MQVSFQRMKNNVRAEKRVCMKLYEVFVIVCILIIPIFALLSSRSAMGINDERYIVIPDMWPVIYTALCALTALFTVRLFRDMQVSTSADVMLSLPLTAKERYFSKLLTFARCILLPYAVSAVLSVIALIIADKVIFVSEELSAGVTLTDYIRSSAVFFLAGLSVIMFTAAVFTICCSFAGSLASAAVSGLITLVIVGYLPELILNALILPSAGVEYMFEGMGFMPYLCFGGAPLFTLLERETSLMWVLDTGSFITGTAINVLLSALVLPLGVFVYRRRDKATLTLDPYIKPLLLGVISITAFAGILYGEAHDIAYVPYAVTIAGTGAFMMLLRRSGFELNKCKRWFVSYAGIMCGLIAVCAVCYFTDGFGYPKLPQNKSGQDYVVDLSNSKENHDGNFDNNLYAEGIEISDLKTLMNEISEYTKQPKCFESFCDFIGLTTREGSDHYFYNGGIGRLASSDSHYYFMPEGYVSFEINCNPYYDVNEMNEIEKSIKNGDHKPEYIEDAAAETDHICIYLFTDEQGFEEIRKLLLDKYSAETNVEMFPFMYDDEDTNGMTYDEGEKIIYDDDTFAEDM